MEGLVSEVSTEKQQRQQRRTALHPGRSYNCSAWHAIFFSFLFARIFCVFCVLCSRWRSVRQSGVGKNTRLCRFVMSTRFGWGKKSACVMVRYGRSFTQLSHVGGKKRESRQQHTCTHGVTERLTRVLSQINKALLVTVVQVQHLGAGGKHPGRAAVRRLRGEVRWLTAHQQASLQRGDSTVRSAPQKNLHS